MAVLVLLNLAIGWVAGRTCEVSRNTLERQGPWRAAKTGLAVRAPFDTVVIPTTQAVARGRLNLGVWLGDHELLLERPLALRTVEFDLWLAPRAYCALLFNVKPQGRDGLLLSSDPAMPGCLFQATGDQKFRLKSPLASGFLDAGRRHAVRLEFIPARVRASLNGRQIGDFATATTSTQILGLRGGGRAAWVDNLRIEQFGGAPTLRFDFEAPGLRRLAFALTFALLVAAQGLLAGALRRRGWGGRRVLFLLLALTPMLLVVSVTAWGYATVRATRYPAASDPRQRVRDAAEIPHLAPRLAEIRRNYDARPKREDTLRVMLLGSSQTYGVGAAAEPDRLDRRLESLLGERIGQIGGRWSACEVFNVAVTALRSDELLHYYRTAWVEYQPDLLVVNLANNDQYVYDTLDPGGAGYRAALRAFAGINRQAGIRTLFVLEANSPERDVSLEAQYAVMRDVGSEQDVPVVDAHGWLAARFDQGFLWWDYVHLSSFGQDLLAQRLAEAVVEALDQSPGR
jgi:lysophospholipase L1-like esterase